MIPPRGPLPGRAPTPGGPGAVAPSSGPGVPSPLPGQQHPAMPPRRPSPGMPPTAVPPGGPMHPVAMQPGMRPPVMNQHPEVPMSEPDRIVIGNRVTVSNMEAANSAAMRAGMPPPGYNAAGAAAAMAAAQGAGLAAAAVAAAAAARQQQYPYGQQYPYDYAAMYGAEWQQLMQQQREAYAASYGLDKHSKVSFEDKAKPKLMVGSDQSVLYTLHKCLPHVLDKFNVFFIFFIFLLTILTISTLLTYSNNSVYNSTMNKVTVHNTNLYYIT